VKPIAEQFAAVSAAFSGATMTPVAGLQLVVIPTVALPIGWSQAQTHIRFVVPAGYPYASPDCFWTDPNLRLAGGQLPQNAIVGNLMPGQPDSNTLWFSWHVQGGAWNAGSCDLMTYLAIIRRRFEALS
jgi:E2/UBC family protein E